MLYEVSNRKTTSPLRGTPPWNHPQNFQFCGARGRRTLFRNSDKPNSPLARGVARSAGVSFYHYPVRVCGHPFASEGEFIPRREKQVPPPGTTRGIDKFRGARSKNYNSFFLYNRHRPSSPPVEGWPQDGVVLRARNVVQSSK